MFQAVQRAMMLKENEITELQTKIRELTQKEVELRNEKVD